MNRSHWIFTVIFCCLFLSACTATITETETVITIPDLPVEASPTTVANVALTSTPTPTTTAVAVPTNTAVHAQTESTPIPTNPAPTTAAIVVKPVVEFIQIPASTFLMGSDESELEHALQLCNASEGNCQLGWFAKEMPKVKVEVSAFSIMKYEVANHQYNACVTAGVCNPAGQNISDTNIPFNPVFFSDNMPVVGVSQQQAATFCNWIGGRLPTEAEWEYAARGTDGRIYPWGNEFEGSHANVWSRGPSIIGTYASGASPFGILDMAGNVYEWVDGDFGGLNRVKGGSWYKYPFHCRAANNGTNLSPGFNNHDIGFRCSK